MAEVWATLGFALARIGDRVDARSVLRRAVSLEPDHWRHLFRHAAGTCGEVRYRRRGDVVKGCGLANGTDAMVRKALEGTKSLLFAGQSAASPSRIPPCAGPQIALTNQSMPTSAYAPSSSRSAVVVPYEIRLRGALIPTVTVVVPTYREVANLPDLIDRLAAVRRAGVPLDLLVMDDDSRDGTEELLKARPESWVRLVVRKTDRGLSAAVLEGLRQAHGDIVVCMDADLSHPPGAIPLMIRKLFDGADFVVGSRYVDGGSTADDWGFLRWANSRIATLLARPLTAIQDPMAGFFALRRATFLAGQDFAPVGYKIGLELIVKCACERVAEVPIHFDNRHFGESKLTLRQQLLYLRHLRRLYVFKYGAWSQLTQFLIVGALGTAVNLGCLTMLIGARMPTRAAMAVAIFLAMGFNFVLNRRFSFSAARGRSWIRQFAGFVAASSVGAAINYATALVSMSRLTGGQPHTAALIGIAAGTAFNFVASRYLVFRVAHVRPVAEPEAVTDVANTGA